MNLLTKFKDGKQVIKASELCELISVNLEDIHEDITPDSVVHWYQDSLYIVELPNGKFWSMVDREDHSFETLEAAEKWFYIPFNVFCDWHDEINTMESMCSELDNFCLTHNYPLMCALELRHSGLVTNSWHLYYLEDYSSRWENWIEGEGE